jgi:hypothetical protein
MQTTPFLPLSSTIKWVTIIASLILLGSIVYLGYMWFNTRNIGMLITLILMTVITFGTLIIVPCKVSVNQENINIHLLAYKINISKDEILKIEHYPHGIESYRIAGAGGFFGNLGLFTSPVCGKHFSLITDPKDACIITRKTKMPIVVSVENHRVFDDIATIQEKN